MPLDQRNFSLTVGELVATDDKPAKGFRGDYVQVAAEFAHAKPGAAPKEQPISIFAHEIREFSPVEIRKGPVVYHALQITGWFLGQAWLVTNRSTIEAILDLAKAPKNADGKKAFDGATISKLTLSMHLV